MLRTFALILAVAAGCGGETTALITVEPASVQPKSLRIYLWGDGLLRSPIDLPLGDHLLPGSLLLRHLDPHTPDFRLLVEGLDAAGAIGSENGAHVALTDGHEARATIQLKDGLLPDSDGDGVPDVVDDCPTVSDPDQKCAATHADGGVDLATSEDLAGSDFAAMPDFATRPMDLSKADLAGKPACPAFAFFCDDFEAGFFDLAKWQSKYDEGSGSTIVVDNTLALSGTQSAHVQATGGLVWQAHTFSPITSGMVAMRAYFYNGPPLAPSVYFFYLHRAGTAPVDADYVVGFDNFASAGQWTVFNKNPGTPYNMPGSTAEDTWHCLELDVTINGDGSNKVEFFVDSTVAIPVNVPAAQAASTLGEFDIGVSYLSGSTANKVHIDDVVLATQHIGCE